MTTLGHSRTWFQKIGMIKVHFLNRISSYSKAGLDLMVTFLPLHSASHMHVSRLGVKLAENILSWFVHLLSNNAIEFPSSVRNFNFLQTNHHHVFYEFLGFYNPNHSFYILRVHKTSFPHFHIVHFLFISCLNI